MHLAGIRVLDLSQYIPGPYASLLLADLGASVVKVEPPGGDPMRGLGPRDADGISPLWKAMNGGKTILELDLKSPDGTGLLADLLARADVLIESYRPGTLDRLGWASGTREAPQISHPPTADFAAAQFAAFAACAALVGRAASGKGAHIDASLADTVAGWQGPLLAQHGRTGFDQSRGHGLLNGGAAFYRIYACADGHVTLGAIEPKFWANFCKAVGRPDWIARQGEALPQTALIAELETLFHTRPRSEWEAVLGPADCCFATVLEPGEMVGHPQIANRGTLGRFPAWLDGAPPPERPAAIQATVASVRAGWGL